jgi:hypothetical protein
MRDSRGKYHFTEPDLHAAEEGYAREEKLHRERQEAHAREANRLLQEANERQFQESLSLSLERARRDRALEEESRHRQLIQDITYLERSSDSDKVVYIYRRFKNEIDTAIVDILVPEFTLQKAGRDGSCLEESIKLRLNQVPCQYAKIKKDTIAMAEAVLNEERKMGEDIARIESKSDENLKPAAQAYGCLLFFTLPVFVATASVVDIKFRRYVLLAWLIIILIPIVSWYNRKEQQRKKLLAEKKTIYVERQRFNLSGAEYNTARVEAIESSLKSLRTDIRSACLVGLEERVDEQFVWRNVLFQISQIEEQFPTTCRLRSSPELDSEIKNKLNLAQLRKEVRVNTEAKVDVFVDKLLADSVKA